MEINEKNSNKNIYFEQTMFEHKQKKISFRKFFSACVKFL